jgi:hypothetical protein
MFDKWQAPDRDSPSIELDYSLRMTDQLKTLLSMEGFDGLNEEAVKLRTGQDVSRPRRWHLMFERMGLLYRHDDQTQLTDLGKELLRVSAADPKLDLARQALVTLSRYQLKNPVDEDGDAYPDDCDIHPYWAVWKACDELDGKLHWDELNREIMRVMRHSDLNATIEKIRAARLQANYDPVSGGTAAAPLLARCYDNETPPDGRTGDGQVRDQRTTPWFKRASLGEYLLSSPGTQGNGYWSIRPEFRQLVHDWVSKGPPQFKQFPSKDEWYRYLSGKTITVAGRPIVDMMMTISSDFIPAGIKSTSDSLLRFAAAVLSKRFVILTGLAGSGKTKLAQAFAHWLTRDAELIDPTIPAKGKNPSSFYRLVPVGADWTGNENILGYPDGLQAGSYVAKASLDLILHAAHHLDEPHFLILDEMNLSHVERYFADVLSIIESDECLELYAGDSEKPNTWRLTAATKRVPPKLKQLPENLFIIGTVNIDETTYMFSPKVLDRANVIEFRMDAGELRGFLGNPDKPDLSKLDGKGESFGKAFVDAAKNPADVPDSAKLHFQCEMLLFFKVLQNHGSEFGYRVAHEAGRFVHFYEKLGGETDVDKWFKDAFDCIIVQKFLPKIHGSESKLRGVLFSLAHLCVNKREWTGTTLKDNEERIDELAIEAKTKADSSENSPIKLEEKLKTDDKAPHYPLSFEKIERMWRAAHENGFASFAES